MLPTFDSHPVHELNRQVSNCKKEFCAHRKFEQKRIAITLYELGYPTANMMNFRFVESTIFEMPPNGFVLKYLKCWIVFRTSSMAIATFE